MALLRWLFHPLFLLLILLMVMLWLYRESLFPEFANAPEVKAVSDRIERVIEKLGETNSNQIIDAHGVLEKSEGHGVVNGNDLPVSVENMPSVADVSLIEEKPSVAESSLVEEASSVEDKSSISASLEIQALDDPAMTGTEDEAPPTQSALQQSVSDESIRQEAVTAGPSDSEQAIVSPSEIWYQARAAMWQEEFARSIALYQQLIAVDEANFDAYGELGNVYLLQGDVDKAVSAYYQAALKMSLAGYPQVAWNVLDIVARLDPEQAESLYQALREQQLATARSRYNP